MIIKPRIFEDEFVPAKLHHREGELEELVRTLSNPYEGDVLVSGPSGVGKTVLSKQAAAILEEDRGFATTHVRCLGATDGQILRQTLRTHPDASGDVTETAPFDDVVDELQELDGDSGRLLVILDEADNVATADALEVLADVAGAGLLAITHHPEEWLSRAPDAVRAQIHSGAELSIGRYTVDELADILQERARAGLRDGAVSRRHLEAIANEVAGVARLGIQSLRAAAEIAADHGRDAITEADVAASYQAARRRVRDANLRSLPFHHQLLYGLLLEAGSLEPSALHERYDEVADDVYRGRTLQPVTKRYRRDCLTKLREYDLVEYDGSNRHGVYQPVDPEIRLPSGVDVGLAELEGVY